MSRSLTRITLAAALALVAALPTVASAGGAGETVEIDGALHIRNGFPAFHGRLIADNENCVEQRVVKLFKEKRSGGKTLLGTGTAENNGKWEVLVDPLESGAYFAVAPRVEQGTAGTIYACLRLKSRTLAVD
jgi:hypothetical protein